jgi:hypothetical protein
MTADSVDGTQRSTCCWEEGAITGGAIILGLALLIAGLGRKGSKAAQHRRERKEAESTQDSLESLRIENADLRNRLDHQEIGRTTTLESDHDLTRGSEAGATDSPVGSRRSDLP